MHATAVLRGRKPSLGFGAWGWISALSQLLFEGHKEASLRFPVSDERHPERTELNVRTMGMGQGEQRDERSFSILLGDPGFVQVTDACYLPSGDSLAHSGLFHEDWTPIEASLGSRQRGQRKGGQARPPAPDVALDVDGRPAIYLGFLDAHFGHTITYFLSRLWILDHVDPRDFRLVVSGPLDGGYPGWMRELFGFASLPIENLQVYHRPTRLSSVIIPRQGLILGSQVWTAALEVSARIGERAAPRGTRRSTQPVYLSRANIKPPQRRVRGEVSLIRELERRKVRVVSPETLSIAEQLGIFRSHETVLGPWGSAHHMKWFTQEPSHHVYLSSMVRPSYLLLDAVNGNASTWIKTFRASDKEKEHVSQVDDRLNPKFVLRTLDHLGI